MDADLTDGLHSRVSGGAAGVGRRQVVDVSDEGVGLALVALQVGGQR